jgi:hypothetical protein
MKSIITGAGWALVERVPKTVPPKAAVFCHLFTATETYMVNHILAATLLPVLLLWVLPLTIRRITTQLVTVAEA